jgi:hypothetical protein
MTNGPFLVVCKEGAISWSAAQTDERDDAIMFGKHIAYKHPEYEVEVFDTSNPDLGNLLRD